MDITCPMCGGTDFDTEDKVLRPFGGHRLEYCRRGFLDALDGLDIQARACLNCGFIAMFLQPGQGEG